MIITPANDLLPAEGERYARRLSDVGALVEHRDVPGTDHGYDLKDAVAARALYALIAHHVRQVAAAR